jgi:hypothetical protein
MTVVDSVVFNQNGDNEDITIEFKSLIYEMSTIFEQNSKVAYAYLLDQEEVISDVWLYNIDYTPQIPEWKNNLCEMPFRNSIEYVSPVVFKPVINQDEVRVEWIEESDKYIVAKILIRGELVGILGRDHKPGWSKMALANSPIAKILNEEQSYDGNN